MKQYHHALFKAFCEGKTKTVGNHRIVSGPYEAVCFYHGNRVVIVNKQARTFVLDDCGWGGYPSTTQCLKGYKELFEDAGYTQVED